MMNDKVYVLQHSYEYGDCNEFSETKFIGVYSSENMAKVAINKLIVKPGFKNYPVDCFYIDEYELDKSNWVEGFICMKDA